MIVYSEGRRLKVGYRLGRTMALFSIVNLQLSKPLTDTFYDPRVSSLRVTPCARATSQPSIY